MGGENSFGSDKQIKVIRQVIPHESEGNQLEGGEVCACLHVCVCVRVGWGEGGEGALCLLFNHFPLFYKTCVCFCLHLYKCSDTRSPPTVFHSHLPVRLL